MKRHHPFYQAPSGNVFAIKITKDKWGFVRFYRGLAMFVLSLVEDSSEKPEIDWNNPPGGWVFYSFAPDNDLTETVLLGNVPFANADAEWAPPCFNPPDIIDNCYKVHFRGTLRRATKEETSDMAQCITLTPSKLQAFLLEKLHKGELRTVKDI